MSLLVTQGAELIWCLVVYQQQQKHITDSTNFQLAYLLVNFIKIFIQTGQDRAEVIRRRPATQ